MQKKKLALGLLTMLFLSQSATAYACTGFIIGKDLTKDGTALYGRTEDLEPNHNKTFVVYPAKTNKTGAKLVDESNGFTYSLPNQSYKYTAVPDVTPKDGVYDEAGFNEFGVSMSATVSATANDKILKLDPYIEDGLAESNMTSLILPSVKTAKEGIELIAKVVTEKGSAEGNIVVLADKEGIWYMEILSGHQYVAIKFPDDKFAVFPNTFFLGHVDFADKEHVIASSGVEDLAKKADSYKEVDGQFHIAQSYNPKLSDGNRSRSYSGIKSLDPDSKVTYKDDYYELLQSTDKKFDLQDAMKLQRNRFEGLELKPLDQMELDGKGKPDSKNAVDGYAYPISNPNVMEAHIFQLKENVPAQLGGGVMWLSVGSPRFAPYLPYYGNITDTYKAYKKTNTKYNKKSWYWTVSHINQMIAKNPDKYSQKVLDQIQELESQWMKEIATDEEKLVKLSQSDPETAAKESTETSKQRAKEAFKQLKTIEKDIAKQSKSDKK
ncbi:C69 family dipeptidase [Streptococcus gallolyticus]|uniref:C69 family dipeptidase n=1 Tax=Streptococcus hepaticus TaxID=3349163 RepID=UPI001C98663B|nr:C69 family dipeptidase [Streptococcus gallolyticus]MBY5041698.1 C69 family dipeptidase [Streptococcus gallolyticus]